MVIALTFWTSYSYKPLFKILHPTLWAKLSPIWSAGVMCFPCFALCNSFTNQSFLSLVLFEAKNGGFIKLLNGCYSMKVKEPMSVICTPHFSSVSNINMHFHVCNAICVYTNLYYFIPVSLLILMYMYIVKPNRVIIYQVAFDSAFSTMQISKSSRIMKNWLTHNSTTHLQYARQPFECYCWHQKQGFPLN